MYLHVGGDVVVGVGEVIVILDGRAAAGSVINQEFVRRTRRAGRRPGLLPEDPGSPGGGRAWVVTTAGVYFSGLSPVTLARRMSHFAEHAASWRAKTTGRTRGLRV